MPKILSIVVLLLALCWGYYHYMYPPSLLERLTQHALDDLSASVATKDQKKIDTTLQRLLADNAHIKLTVSFFTLSHMEGGTPVVQEFTKESFIGFVDNILYSVGNYGYAANIAHFNAASTRQSADVTFNSHEWADGVSYYSGTSITMDFDSHTECKGHVVFKGKEVMLDAADCVMQLKSVPKSGQEEKMHNPDVIRELLR